MCSIHYSLKEKVLSWRVSVIGKRCIFLPALHFHHEGRNACHQYVVVVVVFIVLSKRKSSRVVSIYFFAVCTLNNSWRFSISFCNVYVENSECLTYRETTATQLVWLHNKWIPHPYNAAYENTYNETTATQEWTSTRTWRNISSSGRKKKKAS